MRAGPVKIRVGVHQRGPRGAEPLVEWRGGAPQWSEAPRKFWFLSTCIGNALRNNFCGLKLFVIVSMIGYGCLAHTAYTQHTGHQPGYECCM